MSPSFRQSPINSLPCEFDEIDDFLSEPPAVVLDVLSRIPGPYIVLGAGGKMGLHLSMMLRNALKQLRRDDPVIAVSRFKTLRDRGCFESRDIQTIACDLCDNAQLSKLPDAPVVFYLAGIKFGTSQSPELLHKMNSEMPQRVARRYCRSRIIAFSSGCVYPFVTPHSGGATERTHLDPIGEYAASCIDREEAFRKGSLEHGNPVALIRLNYSIEFRYGILLDIAQKILKDEPIDVTTGFVNLIWQRDAVAKTIQCLDIASSPAAPINITGKEVYQVRDLVDRLSEALQHPATIVGSEAPTAWLSNASYCCKQFGAPETSIDEMIKWVASWLVNDGDTWGKPTGYERRDGRF